MCSEEALLFHRALSAGVFHGGGVLVKVEKGRKRTENPLSFLFSYF
jgi:hypothetical protein